MKNFSICWPQAGLAVSFSCKIILVLLSGMMGLMPLTGQILNVDVNSDKAAFNISGLPWPLATPAPTRISPFYWIFTIYGNGEYSPIIERTKPNPIMGGTQVKFCWENYPYLDQGRSLVPTGLRGRENDVSIGTTFSYRYPRAGTPTPITYDPVSFIIARKGDPPPPPPSQSSLMVSPPPSSQSSLMVLTSNVSVKNDGSIDTISRARTIPSGKSIYLAHSQGYLDWNNGHNQSAFIVSYKPCDSVGGNVHLYYGQKRVGPPSAESNNQFSISDHLSEPFFYLPNYYRDTEEPDFDSLHLESAGSFAKHDVFNFTSNYVKNVRSAIGDSAEFRFFNRVNFHNPEQLGTEDWSYALAVLTSDKSIECDCPFSTATSSNCKLDLLAGLEGFNRSSCELNNQKIIDIDTIYLKSGEPIDPNGITITKICVDGTVFMNLQFCNLSLPGVTEATSSTVDFRIIDTNFVWCGLNGNSMKYPLDERLDIASLRNYGSEQPAEGHARYFCNKDSVSINKDLAPGECASINLILKPINNADFGRGGITFYLEQHQILEASVMLLPNQDALTVKNELIAQKFKLSENCRRPACESCPKRCKFLDKILFWR